MVKILAVSFLLTVASYLTSWWLDTDFVLNPVELIAVFTSYVCTILCVFQKRSNYYFGVVSTAAYSWLLFSTGLTAVALFNLYLVASLAYGWWRWGSDEVTRKVTRLSGWKDYATYAALALGVYLVLQSVSSLFGIQMQGLDVLVAVLSGVAQFLLDNKRLETWIVWAAVNVLSLVLYWRAGLYLVTIQYVFFLANTLLGWKLWKNGK